ncbi:thiopurine S-methyltransferase [Thiolapillus brandeum]|uniref:Thiopurine S-methyltransferase n=1 Tax=Thiolapillus brandeum TaxID=1076588 RepID=A0A7U6JH38_9GAMM|nr:thiopurine S-methyltransferase [Thiolapillus brandeum]BAO43447.1 thiopurine S-methyltransferase [Thiolapillus brandeum]
MEKRFWLDCWAEQRIGFHLPEINPHLQRHWDGLAVPAGGRVLVPLCGKSLDMLWLREKGYEVLGVELSDIALQDFSRENELSLEWSREGGFASACCDGLTLLKGDFFHLQARQVGELTAVYDRAALVALPASMRPSYVEQVTRLLAPGAAGLLVSIDYPEGAMAGPPFSVPAAEVMALYEDAFEVNLLETGDVLKANPRLAEKGIKYLRKQVWGLRRR